MKRNIMSLLLAILLLAMAAVPAQARVIRDQRVPLSGGFSLLALGDGVSAGAGLPDGSAEGSFVNLSAGTLSMTPANHAVDGLTSEGLLAMLAEPDDTLIEDMTRSAVICVSIGSRDFLDLLYAIVGEALEVEPGDAAGILDKLTQMADSEDTLALQALQLNALLSLPKWTGPAAERFARNWAGIQEAIGEVNPHAKIVALTLYNPFAGVEGLSMLAPLVDSILGVLNGTIREGEGCLIADIGALFKDSDIPLTFAADGSAAFDFLPNADGHAQIAGIVTEVVSAAELDDLE